MKKDEKLVLDYVKKQDTSKLHFVDVDWYDKPEEDQYLVERDIERLKNLTSVKERVFKILDMVCEFATFDERNRFQCSKETNRSTVDIWRIYNNYFRSVSIFTIMRALYELVIKDNDLDTLYCHDIKKQVFMTGSSDLEDAFVVNELGVRFAEWRTIGL